MGYVLCASNDILNLFRIKPVRNYIPMSEFWKFSYTILLGLNLMEIQYNGIRFNWAQHKRNKTEIIKNGTWCNKVISIDTT